MISTFQQSAATRQATQEPALYAQPGMLDSRAVQGARGRSAQGSFVERIRTLIDRTLDAAFGRFDF